MADKSGNLELREAVERIANQLCQAVDDNFDFHVRAHSSDETAEKLEMLANFLLDRVRRSMGEIYRLNETITERNAELEYELKVVAEVQRALLPRPLPQIPGLRLASHYSTSRYAGGDYYDLTELHGGEWGILVADAAGHSTPAAVLMAMTCALFHAYPDKKFGPRRVLWYLNDQLCRVSNGSFVTGVFLTYDPVKHSLCFSNAGHVRPLVYRMSDASVVELVCEPALPMGIAPYETIAESETTLNPGDRILLYTDGITERFGPEKDLYGQTRLVAQFAGTTNLSADQAVAAILKDVEAFSSGTPAEDDQTLLLGVVE